MLGYLGLEWVCFLRAHDGPSLKMPAQDHMFPAALHLAVDDAGVAVIYVTGFDNAFAALLGAQNSLRPEQLVVHGARLNSGTPPGNSG